MTLTEVLGVEGSAGRFAVEVVTRPRYVDVEKCIACGVCAEKCPRKVDDEHNLGLNKRKAAYVPYSQAVPLKYALDAANCIYFQKGKCRACEKFCPTKAIDFDQQEQRRRLDVGAIVLAPGFEPYDPAVNDTFLYRRSPNVVTNLEFERLLAASGPYGGHLVCPSDGVEPKRIAWLQCVGSRDFHDGANPYCSDVCCTAAVKEAVVAMEHLKGVEASIFYIDLRTHGKGFERYLDRARDEAGVRLIKSRITKVRSIDGDRLAVTYTTPEGRRVDEEFDLIVLSTGMGLSKSAVELARRAGVETGPSGHPESSLFDPTAISRPGVFICGPFAGPMDIPASVVMASAAAGSAAGLLAEARDTLTPETVEPQERDMTGEPPRIGVIVCHCGTNIAGVVDVAKVAEYARSLPYVVHVEESLFACAQDSQEKITELMAEHGLNRLVVAACTPRTHEAVFQSTLTEAGLNRHLFEMANIRNQCSWVHADDPEKATEKSMDLVRMGVAKAANLVPLKEYDLEVNRTGLVIGGGLAGLTAAKALADQGFATHLVEKSDELGGQATRLALTWRDDEVPPRLAELIEAVRNHPEITVHTGAKIETVDGFVGAFSTTIDTEAGRLVIDHGAAIIATGAVEWRPDLYGYGRDKRVLTGLEIEERLKAADPAIEELGSAVFIQCVGSRIPERPYCSKVCCTRSVTQALALKRLKPEMEVYVLYRDLRTYGFREEVYRRAREAGVRFCRYDRDQGLSVDNGDRLTVRFTDTTLNRELVLETELLILAAAMIPPADSQRLAQLFKAGQGPDGFFAEAHVKLRPVDFATDGVFVCGLAHGPKPLEESIAQAQAAAARAAGVLASKKLKVGGVVSRIDPAECVSCGVCITVCPYSAIDWDEAGKVKVNEALCKGCGLCVASCRSGAPDLGGFTEAAVFDQLSAAID